MKHRLALIHHTFAAGALCSMLGSSALAQDRCRQALALGLDVSGSVDAREYRMQLDGLAGALASQDVQSALLAMPGTPVQIAIYEWSGPNDQTVIAPWRAIRSTEDIAHLTSALTRTTRTKAELSTALGQAMIFGTNLLNQRSECWTRTLDISGDGKSNTGPEPKAVADEFFADVTINALVIGADALDHGDNRQAEVSELSSYFNAYVIHGPSSFVEVALGFEDYEAAMIRKLKRELAGFAVSLHQSNQVQRARP